MSNNVFADLELLNPEERLLKADLVLAIRKMTAAMEMTQAQLADRVGMAQPHVSRMLNGMTKDISAERLLRVVTALGSDFCD
jgi:predicted XRE-type DNA-binding protein